MTNASEQRFLELEWHDALLLSVWIDRRAPGKRDEVLFRIEWPDGHRQDIRFTNCYALDAQMNFGVVAPESIRDARCIAESPRLAEIRQSWLAIGIGLEALRCFEFTTNSTASVLRVFASGFEL